jgi:hypothetical protein
MLGMKKILLCRPQGGLNDMLCQIEKCCRYAEQTSRVVIVDTNYKNARHFKDDLKKYFTSNFPDLILSAEGYSAALNEMNVFPEFLAGRIGDYTTARDPESRLECEIASQLPVTFDFSRDYQHQLLVHHQSGGGEISIFALMRMRAQAAIVNELHRRVSMIGVPYSAIHIRHTDYKTNYRNVLEELKNSPEEPLFVATDNRKVLEEFQSGLGVERVFSFSAPSLSNGKPIHTLELSETDTFSRNQDAILDLFMLALSKKLYLLKLENKRDTTFSEYSGFSRLARNLWSSKEMLKRVISRSEKRFSFY